MSNVKDLELDEILEWPFKAQLAVMLLLVITIQAIGYWFYIVPKSEALNALVEKEQALKSTIQIKAHKAAKLPQLKAQLDSLAERYDYLLQQLPEQKELANMLASVNELGIKHHLTFTRIDWGEKEQASFLYRLPLNIELSGNYHDIGKFSSAIAQLPRIIYFEFADWQRVNPDSQVLNVKVKAYTYQYQSDLSQPEVSDEK